MISFSSPGLRVVPDIGPRSLEAWSLGAKCSSPEPAWATKGPGPWVSYLSCLLVVASKTPFGDSARCLSFGESHLCWKPLFHGSVTATQRTAVGTQSRSCWTWKLPRKVTRQRLSREHARTCSPPESDTLGLGREVGFLDSPHPGSPRLCSVEPLPVVSNSLGDIFGKEVFTSPICPAL